MLSVIDIIKVFAVFLGAVPVAALLGWVMAIIHDVITSLWDSWRYSHNKINNHKEE